MKNSTETNNSTPLENSSCITNHGKTLIEKISERPAKKLDNKIPFSFCRN